MTAYYAPLNRTRAFAKRVRAIIESCRAFLWSIYHDQGQSIALLEAEARGKQIITDDYGSVWSAFCERCGRRTMVVVRIGKAQCSHCD